MKQQITQIFAYLSQLRIQKHLKQKQVAKALGVSEALISRIEQAKVTVSLEKFIRICSILRISPSDVFRRWERGNEFKDIDLERRRIYYRIVDEMIRYGYGSELDTIMAVFRGILDKDKRNRKVERSKREIRKYFPKTG